VLEEFALNPFEERTLFRVLETIGDNYEEAISLIQDKIFSEYDFPHTNINLDWTSFVLWGKKAKLGKYGYSRDHRPDKKQITVGISEIAAPVQIPIGLTIQAGNINDQAHFRQTFLQVSDRLMEGSRIVFDKGGQSKDNLDLVLAHKMKYLSAKKLNSSDDKRIKTYVKKQANLVDEGTYGEIIKYPSRYDYFFFSEQICSDQIEAKLRKAERKLVEAKMIQSAIFKGKPLPKRFAVNNPLVDIKYSFQTKLTKMTETEARKFVQDASINGREGFFCLVSSEELTVAEALQIYRKKDSIEKIFQSLKNDIDIKPLRVWSTKSIYGAVLIGFIAQLIISLIRYDYDELKNVSPKFIKISLMSLTVTAIYQKHRWKDEIFSNFEDINALICCQNRAVT
jgi:transposase